MAVGIFQFCLVFTIGYYVGLAKGESSISEPSGFPSGSVSLYIEKIPPSLHLKDPEDVIVGRGQEAILKCEAQSSALGLSISWFHEGNLVLSNDSRSQLLNDGSLYIPKMEGKKLEGKYQCLAKNNNGAVLSNPAKLKIASIGREFIEQPHNISVAEKQPVILPCQIHSFPNATVFWERDSKPLPHNSRYVPLPSGILLITTTHSSDNGVYRCIASNDILKKTKRSKSGQLTVLPLPTTTESPRFLPLGISPNITVLIGSNLKIPCAVTGWPLPTIQWLNNQGTILSNFNILELQNVTSHTSGTYTCVAYNSMGRIEMHYNVVIQQPPYFITKPASYSYPSARVIRLYCQADGIPPPQIQWLKNGQRLEPAPRIKQLQNELLISHSFTTDGGFYQCVASNEVGQTWVSSQLTPTFSENRPNPPQDVQCRPFDDTSICLKWFSSPNVTIQAYSIYIFNEAKGYDFLTNYTYYLARGLQSNTQYTLYVRSYSKHASDQSNNVSCRTGVEGDRNLTVIYLSETSVKLTWSNISTDTPCGGATALYKVQWKRSDQSSIHIEHTTSFKKIVSRLRPSAVYEFRVQSTTNKNDNSPWITFSFPSEKNNTEVEVTIPQANETDIENQTVITPPIPAQVEAESITPYSINLTWTSLNEYENVSYKIYCIDVSSGQSRVAESNVNYIEMKNLKSNTLYEFKVQTKTSKGTLSPFSHSVEVQTLTDVPSSVRNLKYRVINTTAACIIWQNPVLMNGKVLSYVVSYTSDKNLQFDKWRNVIISESDISIGTCWPLKEDEISIILSDLDINLQYTLVVRATNAAGLGNPTVPISFSTISKALSPNLNEDSAVAENQDDISYKQKLGVVLGVSISALCILCCISCVIFRRRCVKREALRRPRLTAANHYFPSGIPYSDGSLHIRYQESCSAEAHEMQHLVVDDGSTRIPPISSTHLDTKGGVDFPNGQLNGSIKYPQMNGHLANGHIHITENPRYEYQNCNGNLNTKKPKRDIAAHDNLKLAKEVSEVSNSVEENSVYNANTTPPHTNVIKGATNDKTPLKFLDVSDYNSNCNSKIDDMYNTNLKDNYSDSEMELENGLNDTYYVLNTF
ncbi:hypothetical protein RN001_005457 [Aquatica leii]|uniref:Protogenin n=1 Tax=Aquatica leii TaxID=1421715 RepID=A0AAN7QKC4_9COLE|nr:hypothetical protein RN001_005457 [Aquatica leii]